MPVHESTQKRDPGWEAHFEAVTMRVMKKDPSREEYLQAYQSRFWVGGEPSASCPDNKCSEINETVLNGGKMDSLVNYPLHFLTHSPPTFFDPLILIFGIERWSRGWPAHISRCRRCSAIYNTIRPRDSSRLIRS